MALITSGMKHIKHISRPIQQQRKAYVINGSDKNILMVHPVKFGYKIKYKILLILNKVKMLDTFSVTAVSLKPHWFEIRPGQWSRENYRLIIKLSST